MNKKSNNHERILSAMALAPVGTMVEVCGRMLRVKTYTRKLATMGKACYGCYFSTLEGAAGCPYRDTCMAHKRKDRQSVIYVWEKEA